MLNRIEVIQIAQKHIDEEISTDDLKCLVDENSVKELRNGWILTFQLEEWFLSNDPSLILIGSAAIYIRKSDRTIHHIGGNPTQPDRLSELENAE
jgi:hypothetical protein